MTAAEKNQPIRLPGLKPGVCAGLILSGAFYPDLKIGVWRRRTYQWRERSGLRLFSSSEATPRTTRSDGIPHGRSVQLRARLRRPVRHPPAERLPGQILLPLPAVRLRAACDDKEGTAVGEPVIFLFYQSAENFPPARIQCFSLFFCKRLFFDRLERNQACGP